MSKESKITLVEEGFRLDKITFYRDGSSVGKTYYRLTKYSKERFNNLILYNRQYTKMKCYYIPK